MFFGKYCRDTLLLFIMAFCVFISCIGGQEPEKAVINNELIMYYIVIYDSNGADGGLTPVDYNDYLTGQTVTVQGNDYNLFREGYSFIGWNTNADGSGINFTQGQTFLIGFDSIVLYARWSLDPAFSVIYRGNGAYTGIVPVDNTFYETGMQVIVPGNPGNLAKSGYNFAGWNTEADGGGANFTQGQSFFMGTWNVSLYAKWTYQNTYRIFYNNNGSDAGSVPLDTSNYEEGVLAGIAANTGNLIKAGYSFAGWNTDASGNGTTYSPGAVITIGSSDLMLYVKWVAAYSITYSPNGAGSGFTPVDPAYYPPGSTVFVTGNPGYLAKSGYLFGGWNTKPDGSGLNYSAGQSLTMGLSDMVLYASWVLQPVYSVFYDGNEAESGTAPVDASAYISGQSAIVVGNQGNLGRPGYLFKGWNTKEDGTGDLYLPGATFIMGSGNVTLYAVWGGTGQLDLSFDPGSGTDLEILSVTIQSDGKIIIAGDFTSYNGESVNRIARINSDGSFDSTFNPGSGADDAVYAAAVQSDGRIIVAGAFNSFNGVARKKITRLNADGSIDLSFDSSAGANGDVYDLAVQNDGKIIVVGCFTSFNSTAASYIIRLNEDGSVDNDFNSTGTDGIINCVALQTDGRIVIGGAFQSYGALSRKGIARINSDGSADELFNPVTGTEGDVFGLALQADGAVLFGGDYADNGSQILRSLNNGTLDPSFGLSGSGFDGVVLSIAVQSDGKIIVGGTFEHYNSMPAGFIARLNFDGTADSDFISSNSVDNVVSSIKVQPDGRIIIVGGFNLVNGIPRNFIGRILP